MHLNRINLYTEILSSFLWYCGFYRGVFFYLHTSRSCS